MKYTLFILMFIICTTDASAQKRRNSSTFDPLAHKQHVFADLSGPPGFSITYNYSVIRNFSFGAGVQYVRINPTQADSQKFVPALYADARLNIFATKRNQLFLFMNIGANLYKQDKSYFPFDSTHYGNIPHNNGLFTCFGIAYLRRMTKRGGGLYLSLRLMTNLYNNKGYSLVTDDRHKSYVNMSANPAMAIGFKF